MEKGFEDIRNSRDAKAAGLPTFKILTDGAIKAYTDDSGVRRFELIASSDGPDLVDDVMSSKALKAMENAAPGTTMFLNHSYNIPEDVFGSVEEASLQKQSSGGTAKTVLVYKGVVEDGNERAVKTHDMMVKGKTKLGASVSVLITDRSFNQSGNRIIDDVRYLECSIVGIPCNQDSWVTRASKALNTNPTETSLTGQIDQFAAAVEKLIPVPAGSVIQAGLQSAGDRRNAPTSTSQLPRLAPGAEEGRKMDKTAIAAEEEKTAVPAPAETATGTPSETQADKGLFNDAYNEQVGSIYFLTSLLCSAVYELRRGVRRGTIKTEMIGAELQTALTEFAGKTMENTLPQLMAETESTEDDDIWAWYSANRFLDPVEGLSQLASLTAKAGARNSKDDQERLQTAHDCMVECGAKCVDKSADGDKAAPGADQSASLVSELDAVKSAQLTVEADLKALRAELETKAAELAALKTAAEESAIEATAWKAAAHAAKAALEKLGREPLQ